MRNCGDVDRAAFECWHGSLLYSFWPHALACSIFRWGSQPVSAVPHENTQPGKPANCAACGSAPEELSRSGKFVVTSTFAILLNPVLSEATFPRERIRETKKKHCKGC